MRIRSGDYMRIRVSRSLPRIRYKIGLARIKIDKGAGRFLRRCAVHPNGVSIDFRVGVRWLQ